MRILRLPTHTPDLLERCRRGDRRAQRAFCERFAPAMLAVCRRYVRSLEDAEEVLQNALLKALDKLSDLEEVKSIEPWLRRIAANESLNFIRYRQNVFVALDEVDEAQAPSGFEAPNGLEAEELLRLVNALPTGYRVVFNLYAIEGYDHSEIAELLNIDPATSRSQLHKARKLLQSQLEHQRLQMR
ncbi:sigma-70 family RNA polymerase sigma factor [bacterium]|nr:sigma-70 family RNA polymerase sigma factor [bacterium]